MFHRETKRQSSKIMACLRSKKFTSAWIMFLFCGCSCSIGPCPPDGQSIFLTEPRDITAKEGDNVSFSCTAKNSSLAQSIEWVVNPDEPMKEDVQQNTTSRLQIYNIGREERYITCKVLSINHLRKCFYISRRAKMTIQYFPREDELTCSTSNLSLSVQEGDSFYIHCQVTRGNPPVDIGWSMNGLTFRQKPAKDERLTRTSAQIINVTREVHGQYFVCVVTGKVAFPGEKITCSIGPLDVQDSATSHPATDGTIDDPSTKTPNSSPTPLEAKHTKVAHENDRGAGNSIVDLSSLETSTDIQNVSNLTPLFQNATLVWWEQQEALLVVLAISGSLLAVFLTTVTFVNGINRCKSTERHPTEQHEQGGNNDVRQYNGQASFTGTTQGDFKVSADSKTVKIPEQALEKVAGRENAHQTVLTKNSSQNDHTTRRSLRYSDVWSSISSLSDSSATLEDMANVPLKRDRELPGHVSYGNKFLVDLEDVYVIQKLNSRRSSLGLLFLNPSEPTGELRHFTLPRQSGPISLPITDTTKTGDLRKDSLPSSRNHPTASTLPPNPKGPASTSPLQCDSNQRNSETSTSEDTKEMYLHEETKL